ncbi:MAG: hypothetical protein KGZ30_02375, partial [Anaplasmataceae bacterium]|nr:hypothetical protein [Anaplasmataceae bacterium]
LVGQRILAGCGHRSSAALRVLGAELCGNLPRKLGVLEALRDTVAEEAEATDYEQGVEDHCQAERFSATHHCLQVMSRIFAARFSRYCCYTL